MLKGHPERVFWWHELWRWLWGQSRLLSVASSLTRAPRSRYSLRTHLPPRVAGSRRRRSPVALGCTGHCPGSGHCARREQRYLRVGY